MIGGRNGYNAACYYKGTKYYSGNEYSFKGTVFPELFDIVFQTITPCLFILLDYNLSGYSLCFGNEKTT